MKIFMRKVEIGFLSDIVVYCCMKILGHRLDYPQVDNKRKIRFGIVGYIIAWV